MLLRHKYTAKKKVDFLEKYKKQYLDFAKWRQITIRRASINLEPKSSITVNNYFFLLLLFRSIRIFVKCEHLCVQNEINYFFKRFQNSLPEISDEPAKLIG